MEYIAGFILPLAVAGFAALTGLARDRAFYPTVLIVIASYYVLFAVMAGAGTVIITEVVIALGFLLLAVIGFKKSLWLVAVALVTHGVFDFFHHSIVINPGVPSWWPGFCMTFDVVIGVWLGLRLKMQPTPWRRSG